MTSPLTGMQRVQMLESLLADMGTRVDGLERRIVTLEANARARGGTAAAAAPAVATSYQLDAQWGDPVVRENPRTWTGRSMVGNKFSECPPEYLDQLALRFDWLAKRDREENHVDAKGRPRAPMRDKDAALARGWAARIRAGWSKMRQGQKDGLREIERDMAEVENPKEEFVDEEDIPF